MKGMKNKYQFQDEVAQKSFDKMLNGELVVLASPPGSGKTTISHKIINKFFNKFNDLKVLVLTEGQNVLKNQYLESLENPNIDINFTFGTFNDDAQVKVGIPQSAHKLDWKEVDLLIVDEAHHFFLSNSVKSLVRKLLPKYILLLTGTPSIYEEINRKNLLPVYEIIYVSANELREKGVYSGVDLDLLEVDNYRNPAKVISNFFKKSEENNDNISKIMVACSSIKQAKSAKKIFESYGRKVSLSTSDTDKDNSEIEKFKNNNNDVLIVVNKGILGFNDTEITTLLDMKRSSNIDTTYQLFARILRKHPNGLRKVYYRVTDHKNKLKDYKMLEKLNNLMYN